MNPVLIEVTRATLVESRHRGAVAVVDAHGDARLNLGDTDLPVFPRSAVKAIQALPLIESGAADAFGFGGKELALACASHSSEPAHIELARSMLASAGLNEDALECGGHWSSRLPSLLAQAREYSGTPPAICNNCSGKHAGFLCTAAHLGIDIAGYVLPGHPVQKTVRSVLEEVTGASHGIDVCATDGCSIPTYAVPLRALALGFARMVSGNGLSADRATAARRLIDACMKQSFYMAGTDRFCTRVMELAKGRVFVKTGAEGVFCGAIPELGLGIALKCDDGASRASEAMMAAVLAQLLAADDPLQVSLAELTQSSLTNCNGTTVGAITAVTT